MRNELRNCPDCGVPPREQHQPGCDVERCANCGEQRISCDCEEHALPSIKWTCIYPGEMECREFGWYAKLIPGSGWVSCEADDPRASEDLNRLAIDAVWNREAGRFMMGSNV